jgi:hypothetical protein
MRHTGAVSVQQTWDSSKDAAIIEAAPQVRPSRNHGIDIARGLCLVLMTIDHLPEHVLSRFSSAVYGPFGFFTGASGFVLLSGIVSAWVYGYLLRERGFLASWRRALRRAAHLYLCNAALFLLVLTGVLYGVLAGPALRAEFPLIFRDPVRGLWLGLLLIYRPGYLEILPLYVPFLLLTVPALVAIRRGHAWVVIALSVLAWGGIQVFPRSDLGCISPLGFQVLFVAGLCIGSQRDRAATLRSPGFVLLGRLCLVLAAMLFCARLGLALLQIPVEAIPFLPRLTDIDRNGPLRLVNFALFAVGIVYVWQRTPAWLREGRVLRWLAYLGQHSLYVFAWSVMIAYLSMSLMPAGAGRMWRSADLVIAVGSLFIPARVHEVARSRR